MITNDIRQSYLIFPQIMQPFLTWLTGKPLPNQKPLFVLGSLFHFATPFLMVFLGVIAILFSLLHFSILTCFFAVPFLWLVILSGARKLALTVRHQCVHHEFTGSKTLDMFLAELATTILCAQDAVSYQRDHAVLHHRIDLLAGSKDPHVKTLFKYGIKPGMSRVILWKHLFRTLISPSFHYHYMLDRLKNNFVSPGRLRIFMSLSFWILVIAFIKFYHIPLVYFFFAYIIPIIFLYNISALLEIISEHPFIPNAENEAVNKEIMYEKKTWAIMCGSQLPSHDLQGFKKYVAWFNWFVKMMGHFIIRCTVLCGDLSAHDLHHRKPGRYDWRLSIYERQKEIESARAAHKALTYRDVWGFFNAINLVFESYGCFVGRIDPQTIKLSEVEYLLAGGK